MNEPAPVQLLGVMKLKARVVRPMTEHRLPKMPNKTFFALLSLLFMLRLSAQSTITVIVEGVINDQGTINAALYDSSEGFLKFDKVFAAVSSAAQEGQTRLMFKDIPNGTYAIALFHDKNANNALDTNWMGIPKEKVAFSMAKMKLFGPPSFKECAFELQTDKTLIIDF